MSRQKYTEDDIRPELDTVLAATNHIGAGVFNVSLPYGTCIVEFPNQGNGFQVWQQDEGVVGQYVSLINAAGFRTSLEKRDWDGALPTVIHVYLKPEMPLRS